MTPDAGSATGRPSISAHAVPELIAARYGLEVTVLGELPSDRDRNFRVRAPHGELVLKVANAGEPEALVALQDRVLRELDGRIGTAAAPRLVEPCAAAPVWVGADGARHRLRLVSWIGGEPLATCRDRTPALERELGAVLGAFAVAVGGIDDPAAVRPGFAWDLAGAGRVLAALADGLPPAQRALVDAVRDAFARDVAPRLAALPRGFVHGDANDWNVLVRRGPDLEPRIAGLIDIGDALRTVRVADPAIAAAYAIFGAADPLATVERIVAGYVGVVALTALECEVLWTLVRARLAVSVCVACRQRRAEPDNAYLSISTAPALEALAAIATVPDRVAAAALRVAAGHEPSDRSAAVRAWLAVRGSGAAPLLGDGFDAAAAPLVDLSVAACAPGPAAWREALAGHRHALGRYDEARLAYDTAAGFAGAGERRTVHLGVDLFAPAGTAVRAPFDAVVETVAENPAPLDYGPTVILRHEPADGPVFWTLYGHLGRGVLTALAPGARLAAGAAFADLGAEAVNGGWPPHLHFQVIADRLGRDDGDFPGVCAPSRRALWTALVPDPSAVLGRDVRAPRPGELTARRRRLLGPNLSVSYREPLHIVRGVDAELIDGDGRRYVDLVNNVCHVGHANPRVVAAAARQMAVLNTNTRYLHSAVLDYAERLLATFPSPLQVVWFVNSGSEANDLAYRLALAAGAGPRFICLEGAYHGHTEALIGVSPYKHDGRGGGGTPAHVRKVAMPDTYRGPFRGADAAARYAALVAEAAALAAEGGGLAGFIAESLLSCGGQIPLPDGYLAACYRAVRAAGGICIADEVQVGMGRVGDAYWGFELQGVVPDVVTVGKPIGNGHPLAAVVTTRAVAERFANGMEYFNTFGGNPVSAAVGLAVLDEIESRGLQARAADLGAMLLAGLRDLAAAHPCIGDVRGRGLFVGFELVTDRDARSPAPELAAWLVERMKARGFLLSTDGPDRNVIKIKPPLVIAAEQIAAMLGALGELLAAADRVAG